MLRTHGAGELNLWFCSLSTITLFMAVVCEPAHAQVNAKKYALMIGVTTYDHAVMNGDLPLKFPEDDARAVGKLLAEQGYEDEYLLGPQATRDAVLNKLEGLSSKGNAAGVCVVGLFGHGVEMEFLLPNNKGKEIQGAFCPFDTGVRQVVNADGQKQFDEKNKPQMEPTPESLVKMSEVVSALGLAKAGSRLLIADCCRKLPNRPRGRNLGLGANFSTARLPSQTVMLFGCRPGEQALERDDWKHGAFTKSLLEVMGQMANSRDPVTSGTLADRVKRRVQQLTSNQQNPTPVSLDSIDLNFVVRDSAPKAVTPGMRSSPSTSLKELSDDVSVIRNEIDMQLVPVSPGTFWMGSPDSEEGRYSDETRREVTISRSFYISSTEVTQAQYQSVMKNNPSAIRQPQHPVDSVSWLDAVRFCEALSSLQGEKDAGRIYRLPTEAEWEYACRAGQESRFQCGDDSHLLSQYAWYKANANASASLPVKQKQANAWGIYDMHGNVYEWCADWYETKAPDAATTDPTGPAEGSERVMRGGSFREDAKYLRAAARMSYPPAASKSYVGFRVVMEQH